MVAILTGTCRIALMLNDKGNTMSPMQFLKAAQDYAESIGDEYWFSQYYTKFRENHGVGESAEYTIILLYGTDCHLLNNLKETA